MKGIVAPIPLMKGFLNCVPSAYYLPYIFPYKVDKLYMHSHTVPNFMGA